MHETAQKIIGLSAQVDKHLQAKLQAMKADEPDYEAIADHERSIASLSIEIAVYARDLAREVLVQRTVGEVVTHVDFVAPGRADDVPF